ncbi:hypothetical protein [Eikenella corrodens]|uniref:hypothetical protein n=1 Tax=Eikenella corrodens TaxID=539 RepID=UPI00129ABD19|nr:hypothetical protein [Eikenella corrodens]
MQQAAADAAFLPKVVGSLMFGQVLVGCSDILLQFGLLFGCLCLRQLLLPIGFKP